MTGSRHHLRKQTLRVTLESEEQALALQPRLSDFNRRRLLAIIEKVFDAVDVPGLHLRIDRLDVDLGTVPFDDFEQVVEERLTLRLQEAVEQAVQERRSSTREEDRPRTEEELRLELLEHYLLHGTLPFWAPNGVAFSFGALFAELARSSPAALVRLVGRHATLGRVLDRLVLQLDQRQLEQLVMLLEPKHAALLIDYIVSLQALHRIEPVLPLSDRALSRLLWSLTLTYLVKDAGSQFNRKSALKLLLEGVSESQGLDYAELLTTLDSGLEQVRKRHPVLASLSSVIGELVRELPLPEVEEVETPVLDEELATTESASARYELAEALRYYLRHGELPWATLVRMPELTAERVVATLPELPRSLQRRVLGWEQSGGSLTRLVRAVRRIPEEVLSKLLVRLMPRPGDAGSPMRSALPVFAARAEDKPLFFARLLAALLDGRPVVLEELAATRAQGGSEDWGTRDADLSRWEAHALKSALVSRLRFGGTTGPTVEALLGALLTSFPEDSRHFLLALRDTEDLRTVLVDRSGEDVLGRAMDLLRPRESRSMRALLQAMRALPERVLPGGIEGARQTVFHELLLLGETTPLSRSTVSRLLRRLFGAEMALEAQGFLSRVIVDWGASGGVLQKHAEIFRAALDQVRERGGASPSGDVDGSRGQVPHDEDGDVRSRASERAPIVHGDTSSRTPGGSHTGHGDAAARVQFGESGAYSHSVALARDAEAFDRGDSSSNGRSSVHVDSAPQGPDEAAFDRGAQDGVPLDLGHAASHKEDRDSVARRATAVTGRGEESLDHGDPASLEQSGAALGHEADSRERGGRLRSRSDAASLVQDEASLNPGDSDAGGLARTALGRSDAAPRGKHRAPLRNDGSASREQTGASFSRADAASLAQDEASLGQDGSDSRGQNEAFLSRHSADSDRQVGTPHRHTGAASRAQHGTPRGQESGPGGQAGTSLSRSNTVSRAQDETAPGHDSSYERAEASHDRSDSDSRGQDEAHLLRDGSDAHEQVAGSHRRSDAASRVQDGAPLSHDGFGRYEQAEKLLSRTDSVPHAHGEAPLDHDGTGVHQRAEGSLDRNSSVPLTRDEAPLGYDESGSHEQAESPLGRGDSDSHVQGETPLSNDGSHQQAERHLDPGDSNSHVRGKAPPGNEGSGAHEQAKMPLGRSDSVQRVRGEVPPGKSESGSNAQAKAPLGRGDSVQRVRGEAPPGNDNSGAHEQTERLLGRGDSNSRVRGEVPSGNDNSGAHEQTKTPLGRGDPVPRVQAEVALAHDKPGSHERPEIPLGHSDSTARAQTEELFVHSDSAPQGQDAKSLGNDAVRQHEQRKDRFSHSVPDARVSESVPLNAAPDDAAQPRPRSTTALAPAAPPPTVRHTDAPPPEEHFARTIAATAKHSHHDHDALRERDARPSDTEAAPLQPSDTSSRAAPVPLRRPSTSQAHGHPPSTARITHPLEASESPPPRSGTHDSPEAREALFAFLLAESADRYAGLSDDALLRLLHSLLDESPDVLHGFIRRHVHRRHLQEHWARILPDPLLARFSAVLAPRLHTALLSTVEILVAAWQDVAPSDVPSLTERSAFWRFILELLGRRPGASLGLEQLISAFLEHFSTRLRSAHPTHRDSRGVAERLLERAIELAHHESLPRLASVLHQRRSTFLAAWTTPPRSRPPATKPSRQRTSFQLGADKHGDNDGNPIYIDNAGLILTSPFLPHLFRELGLTHVDDQGKTRLDPEPAMRAVHLLQYLVDGRTSAPEPLLVLNKILCGLPVPTPIPSGIEMTAQEQSLCDRLLKALISNWTIISSTSVAGLRETFLQREGRLEQLEDRWKLQVQRKTLDVLVDQVPWSLSILTHPWMPQPLYVSW